MKLLTFLAIVASGLWAAGAVHAGDRTVRLAVQNMTCASCPYIVRNTLAAVPGVDTVEVSFEEKTATVTFDDEKANVTALTEATTNAGYPATLQE